MKDLYALLPPAASPACACCVAADPAARGRLPARRHRASPQVALPLAGRRLARRPPTGEHVTDADDAVGSALIGQGVDDDGLLPAAARRPPATATTRSPRYGSNLGPENPELVAAIEERRAEIAAREGVDPADVPPDAVTASGSGLDPHISPAYAELQVARVARGQRSRPRSRCGGWSTSTPPAVPSGFLGEPHVNVLELNLACCGSPDG